MDLETDENILKEAYLWKTVTMFQRSVHAVMRKRNKNKHVAEKVNGSSFL